MILYSNDVKLCYNRIIYSIASIAIQRLGIPIQPIISIFQTTQDILTDLVLDDILWIL